MKQLKRLNEIYQDRCTSGRELKISYQNVTFKGYALKENLKGSLKDFCWKLTERDLELLNYIEKYVQKD